MNDHSYGTLRTISRVMTLVGAMMSIFSGVGIVFGIIMVYGTPPSRGVIFVAGSVAALFMGLLLLAGGESIEVILDIGDNTRTTVLLLRQFAADARDWRAALDRMDVNARRTAAAVETLAATMKR